jgi:hypothetical protein
MGGRNELKEAWFDYEGWIDLAQDWYEKRALVNKMGLQITNKTRKFLHS